MLAPLACRGPRPACKGAIHGATGCYGGGDKLKHVLHPGCGTCLVSKMARKLSIPRVRASLPFSSSWVARQGHVSFSLSSRMRSMPLRSSRWRSLGVWRLAFGVWRLAFGVWRDGLTAGRWCEIVAARGAISPAYSSVGRLLSAKQCVESPAGTRSFGAPSPTCGQVLLPIVPGRVVAGPAATLCLRRSLTACPESPAVPHVADYASGPPATRRKLSQYRLFARRP